MGLIEQARLDIQRIVSDSNGFGQEITLTAPDSTVLVLYGLHKKIWLGVDTEGNVISTKTATVTISDKDLIAGAYPYRNTNNEVTLVGHQVSVKDITGNDCLYSIQSVHPDETVGVVVCYLNDFE